MNFVVPLWGTSRKSGVYIVGLPLTPSRWHRPWLTPNLIIFQSEPLSTGSRHQPKVYAYHALLICRVTMSTTFFCSSLSLSLSFFIAFTQVSPPRGCHCHHRRRKHFESGGHKFRREAPEKFFLLCPPTFSWCPPP